LINKFFSDLSPERVFLVFALCWGSILVFLNPPFQVPDEPVHFFKAFQVSEGIFFAEPDGITLGGELPVSLSEFVKCWSKLVVDKHGCVDAGYHTGSLDIPLNPRVTQFTAFPNTGHYSPIPHIPQAAGIFLGRILNLPVIFIFYLGRLFNLIAWTILLFIAIKNIPVYNWLLTLLALMPMTIYLAASLSGDATTIALSFLFISLVLKHTFSIEGEMTRKEYVALLLVAMLLPLAKSAYTSIVLLCLMIPVSKFGSIKKYITKNLILLTLTGLVFIVNSIITSHMLNLIDFVMVLKKYSDLPQINPNAQFEYILTHPLLFLSTVCRSFWIGKNLLIKSHVGGFGWNLDSLPLIYYYLYYFSLLAFAVLETGKSIKFLWKQKILIFFSFFVGLLVFSTLMYMSWGGVGAASFQIIQGRYFIPLAPLFWFLFYNRCFFVPESILRKAAMVIFLFSMINTLNTIILRYYVT